MERISGPFGPYYVAAYAVQAENGEFHGYAKICVTPPQDVWLAEAVDKVAAPPQATALAALQELIKERGFNVVLDRKQIVATDPSLEVTDEVMARVNKRLPSIKVDATASSGQPAPAAAPKR